MNGNTYKATKIKAQDRNEWWKMDFFITDMSHRHNTNDDEQPLWIVNIHHPRHYFKIYLKSFIAKQVISILVNLIYLRLKLLKYKESNKKICNTFDHNFKNIPLYIMRKVSLVRYYFVLYDGALTLKMSKMALNPFCDKTLHL